MAGPRILLRAALLLLAASAHAQEDGGDEGARACEGAELFRWHLPHPTDCSLFFKCDLLSRRSALFACAPGLAFNPDAQVCDHARNVRCGAATDISSATAADGSSTTASDEDSTAGSESPSTTEDERTTIDNGPIDESTGESGEPSAETDDTPESSSGTEEPPTTEPDFAAVCSGSSHALFHVSNPDDPKKFYKCDWNSRKAHEFQCLEGLVFNAEIGVCDWPRAQANR